MPIPRSHPLSAAAGVAAAMPPTSANTRRPPARLPEVHLLFEGYVEPGVASTEGYVHDGRARIVIDPGMVPSPRAFLNLLRRLGVSPRQSECHAQTVSPRSARTS